MKNVLSLRPAQFVLGMKEVENKVKKLKKFSPSQRKKYVKERCVPVVKVNKLLYIIDNHHFVRACWEAGVKKVHVKVINKIPKCSTKTLWRFMLQHNWTYLTDQLGNENCDPQFLPIDIRGMADDPYRSLAWAAREAGGYYKITIPFSEFIWASFLRKHIPVKQVRDDFEGAVQKAVKLCRSKAAIGLPGYKK